LRKSVYVKAWKIREGERMVAVCDCDLVGKKFCEGKLVLDLSGDFYMGQESTPEAAVDILKGATVANLVGAEAVRCGVEAGLIHEDCIIRISGIPHAQFVLI